MLAEGPSAPTWPSGVRGVPETIAGLGRRLLRAAPLKQSCRSGVDRGRAQRARYLDDDARTGRSRSVSRSRSRSPSPAARESRDKPSYWLALGLDAGWAEMFAAEAARPDTYAWKRDAQTDSERLAAEFGLSHCDACFEPSWSRAPTNGENIAAELFLRRTADYVLFLYEAKAVVDPESYEALVTLMAVLGRTTIMSAGTGILVAADWARDASANQQYRACRPSLSRCRDGQELPSLSLLSDKYVVVSQGDIGDSPIMLNVLRSMTVDAWRAEASR